MSLFSLGFTRFIRRTPRGHRVHSVSLGLFEGVAGFIQGMPSGGSVNSKSA